MSDPKTYPVEEAMRAVRALREQAGTGPEMFPIPAFVGMISDEIDMLRQKGRSDEDIARIVRENSSIEVTAQEIGEHYAPPEDRHHEGGPHHG